MFTLPNKVYLRAMKKRWSISYIDSPGKLVLIEHADGELALYGKNYSKRDAQHLITRWVRLKAHYFLINLMEKLNRRVKVNYKKVIIRSHEAQWGSYSSTRTISFNYKLIFLPTPLVKHIIYHELCHVRILSHSSQFWKEVAKYDKHWKENREGLIDADVYIPDWANW